MNVALRPDVLAARERLSAAGAAVTTERTMIIRELGATYADLQGDPDAMRAAQSLFSRFCSGCHGPDGQGQALLLSTVAQRGVVHMKCIVRHRPSAGCCMLRATHRGSSPPARSVSHRKDPSRMRRVCAPSVVL